MDIRQEQKKKAIGKAEEMGQKSTPESVEQVEKGLGKMKKGPIAAIWDKVLMLWNAFRSPSTPKTLKCSLIGCLIYLVTPIDLIPDVLVGFGLLDDAAVVIWGCTLLEKFRQTSVGKTVDKVVGQVAGGVVGAGVGAAVGGYAGVKAGGFVGEEGGIENALEAGKQKALAAMEPLVTSLVRSRLRGSLHRSVERSFGNFILFLFSLFLLVSPVFGEVASSYVAALLLLSSLVLCAWRTVRSIRKGWPVFLTIVKERSIEKGLTQWIRSLLLSVVHQHAPKVPDSLVGKIPVEALVTDVKKWCLMDILKFALLLGCIMFSFYLLRYALRSSSTNLGYWDIVLYPFIHAFRTFFG